MKFLQHENVLEGQAYPREVFLSFGRKMQIKTQHVSINPEDADLGMMECSQLAYFNGWYIKVEMPFTRDIKFTHWADQETIGELSDSYVTCRKVILFGSRMSVGKRVRGFVSLWNPISPCTRSRHF
jgi:hypothetical protein